MEALNESGQIRYYLNRQDKQQRSTQNGNVERQLKPLVVPEETPETTMAKIFGSASFRNLTDYEAIVKHLVAYQKTGENRRWDEYAAVMPQPLRETLAKVLKECRRNGFIAPYVFDGEIQWRRVMTHGQQGDLCTLCDRECKRRDDLESGRFKWLREHQNGYREPKACWEVL